MFHPFKAKRAQELSVGALEVTDSLALTQTIGTDKNGGNLDAFKHSYWMASLAESIGSKAAIKLGNAHEKGNYKSFKKGKKEDGVLPDSISSVMDGFNNAYGIEIAKVQTGKGKEALIQELLLAVRQGELKVILKDGTTFLTCDGDSIDKQDLIGSWSNQKCLVPSGKIESQAN